MSGNYTFSNNVSNSPVNPNVGYNYSWVEVGNNAGRPLYAQASYITNLDGLTIALTASNVNIGDVHITDPITGLHADVAQIGVGLGALRVLTQNFDPINDTVSVGDIKGNTATITNSALNVNIVSNITPSTFFQFNNFGYASNHAGWKTKGSLIPMFAVRVKPNQNITAKIAEYELGCLTANAGIGYVWYENPSVTGLSGNWIDINSQLQYAIFNDTAGTENGITGGTKRHSGILIGKNSSSESEISEIPLTGGASPNVLALAVQRLDNDNPTDLWFAVTLAI